MLADPLKFPAILRIQPGQTPVHPDQYATRKRFLDANFAPTATGRPAGSGRNRPPAQQCRRFAHPLRTSASVVPIAAGLFEMAMPADRMASNLSSALPLPP
jgi:hypothetical protein